MVPLNETPFAQWYKYDPFHHHHHHHATENRTCDHNDDGDAAAAMCIPMPNPDATPNLHLPFKFVESRHGRKKMAPRTDRYMLNLSDDVVVVVVCVGRFRGYFIFPVDCSET